MSKMRRFHQKDEPNGSAKEVRLVIKKKQLVVIRASDSILAKSICLRLLSQVLIILSIGQDEKNHLIKMSQGGTIFRISKEFVTSLRSVINERIAAESQKPTHPHP